MLDNLLRIRQLLTFIVLTLALSASVAGTKAGGGGGDSLRCQDGLSYSWDFILTKSDKVQIDPMINEAKTVFEVLNLITKRLERLHPNLALALGEFTDSYRLHTEGKIQNSRSADNSNQTRILRTWSAGLDPLVDIPDEWLSRNPETCFGQKVSTEWLKKNLIQAVRRTPIDSQSHQPGEIVLKTNPERLIHQEPIRLIYEYNEVAIDDLLKSSPVQLSFLLIHEWLRDFLEDELLISILNKQLHTEALKDLDQSTFLEELKSTYKISIPTLIAGEYLSLLGSEVVDSRLQTPASASQSQLLRLSVNQGKWTLHWDAKTQAYSYSGPACTQCHIEISQQDVELNPDPSGSFRGRLVFKVINSLGQEIAQERISLLISPLERNRLSDDYQASLTSTQEALSLKLVGHPRLCHSENRPCHLMQMDFVSLQNLK